MRIIVWWGSHHTALLTTITILVYVFTNSAQGFQFLSNICFLLFYSGYHNQFSSVQLLSHVRLFVTPYLHARLPCPSPTPGIYPNSCPLSR